MRWKKITQDQCIEGPYLVNVAGSMPVVGYLEEDEDHKGQYTVCVYGYDKEGKASYYALGSATHFIELPDSPIIWKDAGTGELTAHTLSTDDDGKVVCYPASFPIFDDGEDDVQEARA